MFNDGSMSSGNTSLSPWFLSEHQVDNDMAVNDVVFLAQHRLMDALRFTQETWYANCTAPVWRQGSDPLHLGTVNIACQASCMNLDHCVWSYLPQSALQKYNTSDNSWKYKRLTKPNAERTMPLVRWCFAIIKFLTWPYAKRLFEGLGPSICLRVMAFGHMKLMFRTPVCQVLQSLIIWTRKSFILPGGRRGGSLGGTMREGRGKPWGFLG